jgi:hypothetical protein
MSKVSLQVSIYKQSIGSNFKNYMFLDWFVMDIQAFDV